MCACPEKGRMRRTRGGWDGGAMFWKGVIGGPGRAGNGGRVRKKGRLCGSRSFYLTLSSQRSSKAFSSSSTHLGAASGSPLPLNFGGFSLRNCSTSLDIGRVAFTRARPGFPSIVSFPWFPLFPTTSLAAAAATVALLSPARCPDNIPASSSALQISSILGSPISSASGITRPRPRPRPLTRALPRPRPLILLNAHLI